MNKRIGILSLGCARNLVDSEVLSGRLKKKGYNIVDLACLGDDFSGAVSGMAAVLINTCSFIKEAKEESVRTILDLIELKRQGRLKKIIVSGCLSLFYLLGCGTAEGEDNHKCSNGREPKHSNKVRIPPHTLHPSFL